MAGTYDGSIRINTKIESAGAKTELASLSKSLKGFAAAVGVAFGVAAVVNFSKECIKLASDLNEVQNVVDTTFGSSAGLIEQFADTAATSFGLSELAAKKYTSTMGAMLKSMGFTQAAAADMSIEMAGLAGDMASFYNLSTDEAFEKIRSGISGETEPLKQLGVNLSVANLNAYALAQGMTTAYDSLSEQNKALLRYNYLLDATSDAQGDFAKTSDSWANQVRILQMQWDSMKATLGGAFIQILTPVLQMLNTLVGRLNAAATEFAAFIALVTGNSQKVETSSSSATEAVDALADSTAAAGEAAKKATKGLAGFDELNTLSSNTGSGSGGAVSSTAIEATTATEDVGDSAESVVSKMEVDMINFFAKYRFEIERVKKSWNELKKTAGGIFSKIGDQLSKVDLKDSAFKMVLNFLYGIEEAANLVIGVIGDLFVALNVPAIVNSSLLFLSDMFKAIGDVIAAITPGIMAFVDKALVPIAEWIGGKLKDVLDFLGGQLQKIGDWFSAHEEDFTVILGFLGDIAGAIWDIIAPLLDSVWDNTKQTISTFIDLVLAVAGVIIDLLAWVIQLPEKFSTAWNTIKSVWNGAASWFKSAVLDPIKNTFKTAINGLIGMAEGFVNGFLGGINGIIRALNKISFKNPLTGTTYGINIPTVSTMKLPRLAKGAVIPPNREFVAVLGDQTRGTNIETPLSTMLEAFNAALDSRGNYTALLNQIIALLKSGSVLVVDDKVLAKVVNKAQSSSFRSAGKTLIEV